MSAGTKPEVQACLSAGGTRVQFFDRAAIRLSDGTWKIFGSGEFPPDSNARDWLTGFLRDYDAEGKSFFVWANAHGGRILWLEEILTNDHVESAKPGAIHDGGFFQCVICRDVEFKVDDNVFNLTVVVSYRDMNHGICIAEYTGEFDPQAIRVDEEYSCPIRI